MATESIRLVIWDLDETFWGGTLTEGGIHYSRAAHDAVITLAARGIVSAICSKNSMDTVRPVLERQGIWEYFVFPSINWDSKGPRLAALVAQMQLRPPTVLFIDDNPQNLAEARHFVPGIQTADETFIPAMLDDPRLHGKDDSGLTRLAQYRLLQQRQSAQAAVGSDTETFLRDSGITVTIEHDLEPHIDRAIELINRTNQLNYTKQRLPEGIDEARAALRAMIGNYRMQAGIVRVRDRYGDYGYCGFYLLCTGAGWRRLDQFCFSCRILGMGVETWLYQRLGQPMLRVQGEVLTDVRLPRTIDWIAVAAAADDAADAAPPLLDYFYARGGCDLLAASHYISLHAREVHGEFNAVRRGAHLRLDHSMFARYGLEGIEPAAAAALRLLGYHDEDFRSAIPDLPTSGTGVWLLSFWVDADHAIYRHRATGAAAPLRVQRVHTGMRNLIARPDAAGADPAFMQILRDEFAYLGGIGEVDFKHNLRLVLSNAPPGAQVFILQANETVERPDGTGATFHHKRKLNGWVAEVAREFPQVRLLAVRDFVRAKAEVHSANHFDRMVYVRIAEHILAQLSERDAAPRLAVSA